MFQIIPVSAYCRYFKVFFSKLTRNR